MECVEETLVPLDETGGLSHTSLTYWLCHRPPLTSWVCAYLSVPISLCLSLTYCACAYDDILAISHLSLTYWLCTYHVECYDVECRD